MTIEIKTFNALAKEELYNILQLRSEVFVVEQDCVYQDIDGLDQKGIHVLGYKNKELIAYSRIMKPGDYFDSTSIGRVVVRKNQRQFGYGKMIMEATIEYIETNLKQSTMALSAQVYLRKFYNELGFQEKGSTYLEDGIPHVKMIRTKDRQV